MCLHVDQSTVNIQVWPSRTYFFIGHFLQAGPPVLHNDDWLLRNLFVGVLFEKETLVLFHPLDASVKVHCYTTELQRTIGCLHRTFTCWAHGREARYLSVLLDTIQVNLSYPLNKFDTK